jgi:hypothetical protein
MTKQSCLYGHKLKAQYFIFWWIIASDVTPLPLPRPKALIKNFMRVTI